MVCKVNNYSEYINYLKAHENMTLAEINQFIGENLLTDRFGIRVKDVQRDLLSLGRGIIKEKEIQDAFERPLSPKNNYNVIVRKGPKSRTYDFLLSEWSKPGTKISITKLEALYKANKLDQLGISLQDVVADIKACGGEVGRATPIVKAYQSPNSRNYTQPSSKAYYNPNSNNSSYGVQQNTKRGDGPIKPGGGVIGKAKGRKSYEHLVSEWAKLGSSLTQNKLEKLYMANKLQNIGLSVHDVAADIEAFRKGTYTSKDSKDASSEIGPESGRTEPIHNIVIGSLEEYTKKLTEYQKEKRDKAYLESEIKAFAISNGIHTIISDYSNDIRLDLSLLAAGNNLASRIVKALPETKGRTSTKRFDTEFGQRLGMVIAKHNDRVDDPVIFRNILWDYFPDRKMEINILGNLFQYGINEDIRKVDIIDDVFMMRYADRLSKDYGIEKAIAKDLINIWCSEYKKSISM